MQGIKHFLIREFLFTLIVSVVAFILYSTVLSNFYLPVFWLILGVVVILTAFFHISILQIQDKGASKFANRFMMVSAIKMMIYLALITSYAFIFSENAKIFLISFFIIYSLYTGFEVFLIVKYFKKK